MAEPTERMKKLLKMLESSPGDTFLLYALAMDYKKAGDIPAAIELFDKVIQHDWGYCYAYHQKGLVLEAAGQTQAAQAAYRAGIDAATRKGDAHAREEIAAALAMIE